MSIIISLGKNEHSNIVIFYFTVQQFSGRTMRVNFSDKPRKKEVLYNESEHKLFVGNLSWNSTSEDLQKAFEKCGNVVSARVLVDGDTGRSRGYGFVCYSTKEELEEALETLDGEVALSIALFLIRLICWYPTKTSKSFRLICLLFPTKSNV
jgi:RNA recognition motif-containing protein